MIKKSDTDYIQLAGLDYQELFLEKEKYKGLYEKYRVRYEMEREIAKSLEKKLEEYKLVCQSKLIDVK